MDNRARGDLAEGSIASCIFVAWVPSELRSPPPIPRPSLPRPPPALLNSNSLFPLPKMEGPISTSCALHRRGAPRAHAQQAQPPGSPAASGVARPFQLPATRPANLFSLDTHFPAIPPPSLTRVTLDSTPDMTARNSLYTVGNSQFRPARGFGARPLGPMARERRSVAASVIKGSSAPLAPRSAARFCRDQSFANWIPGRLTCCRHAVSVRRNQPKYRIHGERKG